MIETDAISSELSELLLHSSHYLTGLVGGLYLVSDLYADFLGGRLRNHRPRQTLECYRAVLAPEPVK